MEDEFEDFTDQELQDNQPGWKERLYDRMSRMGVQRTAEKLALAVFILGHRPLVEAWLKAQADNAASAQATAVLDEMKKQSTAAQNSASAALGSMYIAIVAAAIALLGAIYTGINLKQ